MALQRTSSVELARTLSSRERHVRARALASIAQNDRESATLDAQHALVHAAMQQLQGGEEQEAQSTESQLVPEPEPEDAGGGAGHASCYLNVALVGDWSAGKSTATAGLLLATGAVDPHRLQHLQWYWTQHPWGTSHGELQETDPMPLSAIVDRTRKERQLGTTVDGNIVGFHLPDGRVCTLLDTPGSPEFATKSVQMLSQADAAILVVDATLFTDVLHKINADGHSQLPSASAVRRWQRRMASLAAAFHTFSVKQLVLCVTKMDLVDYRQEVYHEACKQTKTLLYSISTKISVTSLPIAALAPFERSINLVDRPPSALPSSKSRLAWWNGPSLLSALADLRAKPKLRQTSGRAVVIFSRAFKIGGVGTVFVGMVLRGSLQRGEEVTLFPGLVQTKVKTIECFHEQVSEATAGMMVGINIANVSISAFGRGYRGFLLGSPTQHRQNPYAVRTPRGLPVTYLNPTHVHTDAGGSKLLEVRTKTHALVGKTRCSGNE